MLDRAGNADRDVKFRGHHLAGLPDLPVIRRIARIDRGARRADGRAKLVRQLLDQRKVVLAADTATARDHHTGRGQIWPVACGDLVLDPFRQAGIVGHRHGLDGGGVLTARSLECRGTEADNLLGVLRFDRLDGVARIDRALERVGVDHIRGVRDHHDVQKGRDTRQDILGVRRGRRDDMLVGIGERHDQSCRRFRKPVPEHLVLGDQNLGHTGNLRRSLARRGGLGPGTKHRHIAQFHSRRNRLGCGIHVQVTISNLGK